MFLETENFSVGHFRV